MEDLVCLFFCFESRYVANEYNARRQTWFGFIAQVRAVEFDDRCDGAPCFAKVLRGGTLSDKVAALTLQVQESPVHRLEVLDRLLDLGLKNERRTVSQVELDCRARETRQFRASPEVRPSVSVFFFGTVEDPA